MIKGKKYEISGIKWIQENFDKEARVFGGADSQAPIFLVLNMVLLK